MSISIQNLIGIQGLESTVHMTSMIHAVGGTASTCCPRKTYLTCGCCISRSLITSEIERVKRIFKTYLSILAISLTASTPPGSGSSSMKKSLDSQMLMAFSWINTHTHNCISVDTDKMNAYAHRCALKKEVIESSCCTLHLATLSKGIVSE